MKITNVLASGGDIRHLRQTSDGFVDYDFYMAQGRKLQGKAIGDMVRQAGRHMIGLLHLAK